MLILPLDHSEPYFANLGVMLWRPLTTPIRPKHEPMWRRFSQEPSGVFAARVEARYLQVRIVSEGDCKAQEHSHHQR